MHNLSCSVDRTTCHLDGTYKDISNTFVVGLPCFYIIIFRCLAMAQGDCMWLQAKKMEVTEQIITCSS